MKLASLKDGTRDGKLIVVSRDLRFAVAATEIAKTMQAALDDWDVCHPTLESLYTKLNAGDCGEAFPFDTTAVSSPLPRAYQWADASAYVNHVELVRKARGAEMPENFWTDPLMYQGGSDYFLAPNADIVCPDVAYGIDFEAEVAVVTGDVPMHVAKQDAGDYIRLIMLVNDVSLRQLVPNEMAKGFGFFQSKPPSAFSPVAITPDELGGAWESSKVHLPIVSKLNGKIFGEPNAGNDMTFNFAQLIAHAAYTRPLTAGTIIGSGTVSNVDRSKGSSCIAERRMIETIENGNPSTPFMLFGDRIRIEMFDENGHSIFGAIDQKVAPL